MGQLGDILLKDCSTVIAIFWSKSASVAQESPKHCRLSQSRGRAPIYSWTQRGTPAGCSPRSAGDPGLLLHRRQAGPSSSLGDVASRRAGARPP